MVLIKSSQETDVRILNYVSIGGNDWTWLNMSEYHLWSINHINNNNLKHKFMAHTVYCGTRVIYTNDIVLLWNTATLLVV